MKVLQIFLLSCKFLKSLGYRGLASVMRCKHPFVKVHASIECFTNRVCQFCSGLAVEIHEFMLDMQIFYTLLRHIFSNFFIGLQPSQLNLDDFCNLLSSFFKFSHYYRDLFQYRFCLLNIVDLICKFHLNLIHLYFEQDSILSERCYIHFSFIFLFQQYLQRAIMCLHFCNLNL